MKENYYKRNYQQCITLFSLNINDDEGHCQNTALLKSVLYLNFFFQAIKYKLQFNTDIL